MQCKCVAQQLTEVYLKEHVTHFDIFLRNIWIRQLKNNIRSIYFLFIIPLFEFVFNFVFQSH